MDFDFSQLSFRFGIDQNLAVTILLLVVPRPGSNSSALIDPFSRLCSVCSSMAVSVSDICENTKLAREMSLLGNYETASVYYQGVVQQIHR